jgi:hypothetical protein
VLIFTCDAKQPAGSIPYIIQLYEAAWLKGWLRNLSSSPIKFPTGRIADLSATVLLVLAALIVCGLVIGSIVNHEYSDAFILLAAVLTMDPAFTLLKYLAEKDFVKTTIFESRLMLALSWSFGIAIVWLLMKVFLPNMFTSDFRIMGMILLALLTLSSINAVRKINVLDDDSADNQQV